MGKFKELVEATKMGYGEEKDDYDIFGEMLPKSSVDLLKSKSTDSRNSNVKECAWHDWKNYTGLNESYDYCTVCDAKRQKGE